MKNKLILFVFLLLCINKVFSESIKIAPLVIYDQEGGILKIKEKAENDIAERLKKYWFSGMLSFETFSHDKNETVISALSAEHTCKILGSKYLLYGYIKKMQNSWEAEIKFYNSTTQRIEKAFFSSDDISHYDRLLNDIAGKIASFFIEYLAIEDTNYSLKKNRPFEIAFPFSFNYWSPLNAQWCSAINGIFGFDCALDIFPSMKSIVSRNKTIDFCARFNLGYKMGIGNLNKYKAFYHGISFATPIIMNLCYTNNHKLTIGFGPLYEIDFVSFQKKYDLEYVFIQNQFGLEFLLGYEYSISKKWKLYSEVEFDFYFTRNSFAVIKPKLGAVYSFYRRKV